MNTPHSTILRAMADTAGRRATQAAAAGDRSAAQDYATIAETIGGMLEPSPTAEPSVKPVEDAP